MDATTNCRRGRDALVQCLVLAGALGLALLSARPYAGGWNDGSRLATVESLVDRHTWIIDQSLFVQVPAGEDLAVPPPYPADEPSLLQHGTCDKLFIHGHYYSDKSPVPALYLAACYQAWQWATGWTARQHPDRFCQAMTLASSGLAYAIAVLCIYRLARRLGLSQSLRLALTASFALATVALPYAEHVNNHILLLAVTAALVLGLAPWSQTGRQGDKVTRRQGDRVTRRTLGSWWRLVGLGCLAGLGYTIDLGTGPVLLLCTSLVILARCAADVRGGWAAYRWPPCHPVTLSPCHLVSLSPCLLFGLAVLPWLVLHHAINYAIGGSLAPANANPEYFLWPECPFDARNLTGSWAHESPFRFLLYAGSMLGGKRGFLGHNLPLFLLLPGLVILLRRRRSVGWAESSRPTEAVVGLEDSAHPTDRGAARRGERWRWVLWAAACCGGTWLLYAATSNNSSGRCCSIRWFVPLLAPAYGLLALLLRRHPRSRIDFLVLSAWGAVLVLLMREGPWMKHMVPFFWPLQAAALLSWALCRYLRRQSARTAAGEASPPLAGAGGREGGILFRSGRLTVLACAGSSEPRTSAPAAVPASSPRPATAR